MSAITLTAIKVAFLALLWLFIILVTIVIRRDVFGRTVSTPVQAGPALQNPPGHVKHHRGKAVPSRLSITSGPRAGAQTGLETGHILIGRGTDCDLILDDDYVSARHARVVASDAAEGNGAAEEHKAKKPSRKNRTDTVGMPHSQGVTVYIEDLGSTNGTYVNGKRIFAPTTITLADTVRIGKTVLKLES
jgi:hypothetical protein